MAAVPSQSTGPAGGSDAPDGRPSGRPGWRTWPRWLRWSLALLALLGLLAALLTWGLPALLLAQLPPRLSQALGRPVTLQAVDIVPWRLELTLRGLAIDAAAQAPANSPPLLVLNQARAALSWQSLRHLAPVVQALQLDGLRLHLARTAPGHYDIDDLLARVAGSPQVPAAEPARFALYNLVLRDAQLQFDDHPVAKLHQVTDLLLTLPFLSNLPGDVAVRTEPRLAFSVNGTRFDSGAQALPFASQRSGELTLAFKSLDLQPWLAYLPDGLPLRLQQAKLSTDLKLRFLLPADSSKGGLPSVSLQGRVALDQVALSEPGGAAFAGWSALSLGLNDVQPLARKLDLGTLQVDGAQVQLARDAQGRLNLERLFAARDPAPAPSAAQPALAVAGAASSPAPTASAAPVAAGAETNPWQLSLAALELRDATLRWADAAVQPAAAMQLEGLALKASALQWPGAGTAPITLSAALRTAPAPAPLAGRFNIDGAAGVHGATLALALDELDLAALQPYLATVLRPKLSGQVGLLAKLTWSAAPGQPAALGLALDQARLQDLQLRDAATPRGTRLASVALLQMGTSQVDLLERRWQIGPLLIKQPMLALARDASGALDAERWLVQAPTAATSAPAKAVAPAKTVEAPWRLRVDDLSWQDGQLQWADAMVGNPSPLRLRIDGLRGRLQGLAWPATAGAAPARLNLAARIGDAGNVDWQGRIGLLPLQADGKLQIHRLPVHLLMPYGVTAAGTALPVLLAHADASFQGQVQVQLPPQAALRAKLAGDLQVNEVQVLARAGQTQPGTAADPLLTWQSLAVKGVQAVLAPGAKPRVEVQQIDLHDFYSRLVITEQGRFNLQDVAAGDTAAPADASASAATPAAPAAALATPAASAASPAQPGQAPPSAELPIDLVLVATRLHNGRVDFSDHFIRPNYSARLTELNGEIGTLRSGTREMARISLRGRAADTALLDISGQLNPTVQPLALDIRARATDLELAPLSPYAGKYAGYAIERGKLSVDVAYKIDADGKLAASNQVILNQLTFGDKVDSPSATSLPVRLAVALLKDRNGVIDINLPVSGSVNDPQFSVGGIVWKLIVNLIGKALTAPFALLSGGGADDLSLLEFVPGTARLATSANPTLAKVAQALLDRPSLSMTVAGVADPAAERAALQQALLDERLLTAHRLVLLRDAPAAAPEAAASAAAAASAPPATPAAPALSPEQRQRALATLYQQAAMPDKPRNAQGQPLDLPSAEMEARLLAQTAVSDDNARDLALQRGLAVRDALINRGLPSDRLFLAAPKLRASGQDDKVWTPRVELTLSSR